MCDIMEGLSNYELDICLDKRIISVDAYASNWQKNNIHLQIDFYIDTFLDISDSVLSLKKTASEMLYSDTTLPNDVLCIIQSYLPHYQEDCLHFHEYKDECVENTYVLRRDLQEYSYGSLFPRMFFSKEDWKRYYSSALFFVIMKSECYYGTCNHKNPWSNGRLNIEFSFAYYVKSL